VSGVLSYVYRCTVICLQVYCHMFTDVLAYVYRCTVICLQVYCHMFAGVLSYVYRYTVICLQVYCHMFAGVLSLQISIDNPGGTRHGRCRFHGGYYCLDCYFPGVEGVCICVFTLEASLHAMR